jgi:hypothetical protein
MKQKIYMKSTLYNVWRRERRSEETQISEK